MTKSKYYYDYTRNMSDEKKVVSTPPNYYVGIFNGIKANEVIDDFLLSYNVGTAVTYLLRAGKKPQNSKRQDIQKAIDHLNFELKLLDKQEYYEK